VGFPLTAAELRKAEARYQRAFLRSEAMREQRNAAVREALREGWTHAQIAQATGLTRSRVGQIAQR
jgi:DNA-binding NarL/FixJ family response regulator